MSEKTYPLARGTIINATRDRLRPLFIKAEEDRLLTKTEVCAKNGEHIIDPKTRK